MVSNQHQVPGLEFGIEAAAGIGYHQALAAQGMKHIEGKGNLLHCVALIKVKASLHGNHLLAFQGARTKRPAWPATVETGKWGMVEYSMNTGSAISSAKSPRPEPRIRA